MIIRGRGKDKDKRRIRDMMMMITKKFNIDYESYFGKQGNRIDNGGIERKCNNRSKEIKERTRRRK